MDWDDYLRDEARKYRKLAEQTEDLLIKRELLELAEVCDKVANSIEDRMTAG
jgi:cytidylate kinase